MATFAVGDIVRVRNPPQDFAGIGQYGDLGMISEANVDGSFDVVCTQPGWDAATVEENLNPAQLEKITDEMELGKVAVVLLSSLGDWFWEDIPQVRAELERLKSSYETNQKELQIWRLRYQELKKHAQPPAQSPVEGQPQTAQTLTDTSSKVSPVERQKAGRVVRIYYTG